MGDQAALLALYRRLAHAPSPGNERASAFSSPAAAAVPPATLQPHVALPAPATTLPVPAENGSISDVLLYYQQVGLLSTTRHKRKHLGGAVGATNTAAPAVATNSCATAGDAAHAALAQHWQTERYSEQLWFITVKSAYKKSTLQTPNATLFFDSWRPSARCRQRCKVSTSRKCPRRRTA